MGFLLPVRPLDSINMESREPSIWRDLSTIYQSCLARGKRRGETRTRL